MVVYGEVKNGENALVHAAASGVGIAAIQLARFRGALVLVIFLPPVSSNLRFRRTVTATASTQEKLDWLLAMKSGATHAVNYKTQDFASEVKKATDGKGVDVIIDFVGQSHWAKNIDSLAVDGRMTMLALLSGMWTFIVGVFVILTVF